MLHVNYKNYYIYHILYQQSFNYKFNNNHLTITLTYSFKILTTQY